MSTQGKKPIASIKVLLNENEMPRQLYNLAAPETSHAVAMAIREPKQAKEEGKENVIVFGLSGHGLMDLAEYDKFFSGALQDYELPPEVLASQVPRLHQGLSQALKDCIITR